MSHVQSSGEAFDTTFDESSDHHAGTIEAAVNIDVAADGSTEEVIVRGRTNVVTDGAIRSRICTLYDQGNNVAYIAQVTGVKRSTTGMIIKRYKSTGDTQAAPRGGDQRSKLTETHKAQITQWVDDDCLLTLDQLRSKVLESFSI